MFSFGHWVTGPDFEHWCKLDTVWKMIKKPFLLQNLSFENAIACDNSKCKFECFHYFCITQTVKGKWHCKDCMEGKKKKNNIFIKLPLVLPS